MARIVVRLHGEEVAQLNLESGNEYIAGRASDAHIHLAIERGISRHHLKFYERDGVWVCQTLSKFSLIQRGETSVDVLELTEACAFSVPPYVFWYEISDEKHAEEHPVSDAPAEKQLPTFLQPRIKAPTSPDEGFGENTSARINNEATIAGVPAKLIPYFRISYPNTADDEVLKLEGHLWVAGRDPNCEIPIDSPHISRKHFELARTKEGFFITDLGSSNGTKLNHNRIPPHEPTQLNSGDELEIKNITMVFEIRDANFSHRLDALPVPAFDPFFAAANLPAPYIPPGAEQTTDLRRPSRRLPSLKELKKLRWKDVKAMGSKKLIMRGGMVLGALVFLIMNLIPSKTPPTDRNPANQGNNSVSFEKLTVEQRSVVKDSFNLAKNLYVQGKYQLCLTELAKLHELIPLYENSKELESYCKQGEELVEKQRDLDRKEHERQENDQKISGIVDNCKATLKDDSTIDEIRTCLAPAMELDPEHHLIVEMIHTAQMHEEEKKFNLARKKEEEQKARKGLELYRRAEELHQKGELQKALKEYERFLSGSFPRSEENKNKARREVASITTELKTKIGTLYDQCKSLAEKNQYKDAYNACNKVIDEDPGNEAARAKKGQMLVELKRELRSVYEDSVLEESLGNVDSAKEKWKRIMGDDIEGGEYAEKAKIKLQKYGAGP